MSLTHAWCPVFWKILPLSVVRLSISSLLTVLCAHAEEDIENSSECSSPSSPVTIAMA